MKPENSVTADISSSLRFVKRPQLALHFPRKEGGGLVAITPCTLRRAVTERVSLPDSDMLVRSSSVVCSPWEERGSRGLLWAEDLSGHVSDPAQKWLLTSFLQQQFFSKGSEVSRPVTRSTQIFDPQAFLTSFRGSKEWSCDVESVGCGILPKEERVAQGPPGTALRHSWHVAEPEVLTPPPVSSTCFTGPRVAERSQDLCLTPPHRCEVLASAADSRSPGFSSEVHHLLTGGSPGDVTPASQSPCL